MERLLAYTYSSAKGAPQYVVKTPPPNTTWQKGESAKEPNPATGGRPIYDFNIAMGKSPESGGLSQKKGRGN